MEDEKTSSSAGQDPCALVARADIAARISAQKPESIRSDQLPELNP